LHHCVAANTRDVRVIDVELGAAFCLELFLEEIRADEGEILARDAVALWRVAVASVGETNLAHAARDKNNVAADALGEILLEDPAVIYLDPFDHETNSLRLRSRGERTACVSDGRGRARQGDYLSIRVHGGGRMGPHA